MRKTLAALILGLTLVGISFAGFAEEPKTKAELQKEFIDSADNAPKKVKPEVVHSIGGYTYYYYNNYKAINEVLAENHLRVMSKKEITVKKGTSEKVRMAHLSSFTRYYDKVYPIKFEEYKGSFIKYYEWSYNKSGRVLYEYSLTIDEDYLLQKAKAEGRL